MVEIFKTNVMDTDQANLLLDHIHNTFTGYKANFDLQDCDRILRIACTDESIHISCLIELMKNFGFKAEVLEG